MDVVILGAGGHGRDVAEVVLSDPHLNFVTYLDDQRDFYQGRERLSSLLDEYPNGGYLLGVHSSDVRYDLDRRDVPSPVAIHSTAAVGTGCEFGAGTVIGPLAVLQADVVTGRHVHIGGGGFLTRARLGDYVTISPGVHIGGDVTIGSGSTIGIGARVRNLVNIGKCAIVGAGAVVINDVPDYATVVGVPAKEL